MNANGPRELPTETLVPFDPLEPDHIGALVEIWNAAAGPGMAITPRFVQYNTRPATGSTQAGRLVLQAGRMVGFALASHTPDASVSAPRAGWVDVVAVRPEAQRQGVGSVIVGWAEDWLRERGCTLGRAGGSLHPFFPGIPTDLGCETFFLNRDYRGRGDNPYVWDLSRDLLDYQAHPYDAPGAIVHAMEPDGELAVLEFFTREFPGRWRFEFQEFVREGGRHSDYLVLRTERGVDGFARLTFEDSERPIERFYLHAFPHPWGQLGPIGISAGVRGKGYGGLLLDAGLQTLRDRGVRGSVIDWTHLVELYGKFGYRPYHQFAMLTKNLSSRE